VREGAIYGLAEHLSCSDAVDALRACAQRDPVEAVRNAALDALANLDDLDD
jgi:hypothetical protein